MTLVSIRRVLILGLLAIFCVVAPGGAEAPIEVKPDAVERPQPDKPDNNSAAHPDRVLPGEKPTQKSYLIPALEIPIFITILNRADLLIYGSHDYDVSWKSTRDHINHGPWVVDQDVFTINQIGHPYQGATYYGFARSANLNYWESYLYSNAGSAIWEMAGETTDPSINDQVASGTAGSFLGEALYRLSNLVLEDGSPHPGAWRHLVAGLISPPTELNRLIFGERFGPVFEGRSPAVSSRLSLGAGSNATRDAPGSNVNLLREVGYGDFELSYGLPGKPGYRYLRPFDYFNVQVNTIMEKGRHYDSGMVRGLLFGAPYESGESYRGVWGLYGSYDYMALQAFRVSTTAASLGTTGQWWLSRRIALQGTALAGLGYGAAGTILPDSSNESDYHYGATPQQLLALRLLLGKRAMCDVTGRNYYITGIGARKARGTERIQQANGAFTLRLFGHQAISVGYLLAHRTARYDVGLPRRNQLVQTVTLTYTLLGHPHFRAVDWRGDDSES